MDELAEIMAWCVNNGIDPRYIDTDHIDIERVNLNG